MKIQLDGPISMNCYIPEHNGQCYIIDPGFEAPRIRAYIAEHKLNVLGVLLTHAHYDHMSAVSFFDVPIYLHADEFALLRDDEQNATALFRAPKNDWIKSADLRALADGDELPFDDTVIRVLHTPGHTAGSVSYLYGSHLFSGDTLFKESVGRSDFATGSEQDLCRSVTSLIEKLPEETVVHPGHGEDTTIGHEKMFNPFYVSWKTEQ